MKIRIILGIALVASLASCGPQSPEDQVREGHTHHDVEMSEEDLNSPKSIKREAHGQVGENHVTIHYYSPGVRGRVIWGGLVAMDQVWVTGAHQATNIEFSHPIQVEGQTVSAGKYAFFTIPGKDSWTLILNRNWDQHLADEYSEQDDVLRLVVTPEEVEETERLEYAIQKTGDNQGEIQMRWEKLQVVLPFQNQ